VWVDIAPIVIVLTIFGIVVGKLFYDSFLANRIQE